MSLSSFKGTKQKVKTSDGKVLLRFGGVFLGWYGRLIKR